MSFGRIPTIKVVRNGNIVTINESDYDSKKDVTLAQAMGDVTKQPDNNKPDDEPQNNAGSEGHIVGFDENGIPITIPADWRESLEWQEMRTIASRVSEAPIRNKDEAMAAIQAFVIAQESMSGE